MNKYKFLLVLIFVTILLIEFSSSQAIFGVTPANILFNKVLRGGYSERPILITLDSVEEMRVSMDLRGEIKDWINLSAFNITVSRDKPARIIVSVMPPSDIPNGNYSGFLRVRTSSLSEDSVEGHATGIVQAVVDISIHVEIVDQQIDSCTVNSFVVNSVEKGDEIYLSVNVSNQGNVRLRPRVSISLWNQDQTDLVQQKDFTGDEILPSQERNVQIKLPSDNLETGQYWTEFSVVDCFASNLLTFDVLSPGALKAEGVIVGFYAVPWNDVGDTIPIVVNFRNIGKKDVDAQFKGQIVYDNKIIQLLQSEKINFPILSLNNFTFFFTPKSAGKYVVSGRVFYENKRTFESGTVINVRPDSILSKILLYLLYIFITALVLFLAYKVRKEKLKYFEALRSIRK